MTPRRSYYWVGIPYAVMGLGMLVWAYLRAEWSMQLLMLVGLAGATAFIDRFSDVIAPKLLWSQGGVALAALFVAAPLGAAPFTGCVQGLFRGYTEDERTSFAPGRVLLNAGQLAVTNAIAGLVFETLSPDLRIPSLALIGAAAASFLTQLIINTTLTTLAVTSLFGWVVARPLPGATILLGPKTLAQAMAATLVASSVATGRPAFVVVAIILIMVVFAIPIVSARLRQRRLDMLRATATAIESLGITTPQAAHVRMFKRSRQIGHRLGFTPEELDQVEHLSMLYAMTDLYARELPQSWDQQISRGSQRLPSWSLLTGLRVHDLGTPLAIAVVEASAIYEAQIDDDDCPKGTVALEELAAAGVPQIVVDAADSEDPIPRSYSWLMEVDPHSILRRPLYWWVTRHARAQRSI